MRNMKKIYLYCLTVLVVFVLSAAAGHGPGAAEYPALLCGTCGFGSKANNCIKCGKWVGSTSCPACLCSSCGFGSKGKNCVKCGKWVGSNYIRARLCGTCGFGDKKQKCIKCGKWTPRQCPLPVSLDELRYVTDYESFHDNPVCELLCVNCLTHIVIIDEQFGPNSPLRTASAR